MAITFHNPSGFWWALAAVPVVLLYLRRVAPPRRVTPAGFLWQDVLGPPRPVSRWWQLRRWLSLALQLAIVCLLVLAVADPATRPARRIVLVLDNSLGMTATDIAPNRLEEAKRLAKAIIAGLGYRERCAVVTGGGKPLLRVGFGDNRILLRRAIDEVSAVRRPGRIVEAVALARRMLADRPNGRIIVLSGGCFGDAAMLASEQGVVIMAIGGRSGNATLTQLVARRQPAAPQAWQALVEVSSFSDQPSRHRLLADLDGNRVAEMRLDLPPGERVRRVLKLDDARPGQLSVRLDPPDAFVADDVRSVRLAEADDVSPDQLSRRVDLATRPVFQAATTVPIEQSDIRPGKAWLDASQRLPPDGGVPLWPYLAATALAALVVQWQLFHRRWTC